MEHTKFEIQNPGPWPFHNAKTGAPYILVRADQVTATKENIAQLVEINNEPDIYSFLWRRLLNDSPYDETKARGFFEWSAIGWRKQEYFVFVALSSEKQICATIDIKTNERARAEIGYWVSQHHAGLVFPWWKF